MTRPVLFGRAAVVVMLSAALSCIPPQNADDGGDLLDDLGNTTVPSGAANPRTVAELGSARVLPPVPSALVGLRLVNRLPRELRVDVSMTIRNDAIRIESRRLPSGATILVGPDEADQIQVDARTTVAPLVAFQQQTFLLGDDFRPDDLLELVFEDRTPPTLECPPDLELDCTASLDLALLGAPAASDDLGLPPRLSFTDSVPGACRDVVLRTWTATDDSGNTSSCVQRITLIDATPPTIRLSEELVVDCDAAIPSIADSRPIVTDNCDPAASVIVEERSSGACPRVIERTWRASDVCGNVATAVQRIIIEDRTPPLISLIDEVRLPCGDAAALTAATATVFDACDPDPLVKFHDVELEPCPRVIERSWTATDACGNTATAVQRIVLEDTTAPNLLLPPDITIACGADESPAATGHAQIADDCDEDPVLDYEDLWIGECPGRIERTWIGRDACGNERRGLQIITIEKLVVVDQPPSVECPPNAVLFCDEPTDPESLGYATAVDDFDPEPLVFYEDELVPGCPHSIVRAWYAVDAEGQVSEPCFQLIDVLPDVEPPYFEPKSLADPFDALCGDAITPEVPRLVCAPGQPFFGERRLGDPHPERVQVQFIAQGQIGDLRASDPSQQPQPVPTPQPELRLRAGEERGVGFLVRPEADFDWFAPTPGGFFEFSLGYNPFSGLVSFTVGQTQVSFVPDVDPALLKDLLIRAQAVPGTRVEVSHLSIEPYHSDGPSIALPDSEVAVPTAEARYFGRVGCGALADGFILRGRVALILDQLPAGAPPTGDQVSFQIIAGKYTEPSGTGRPLAYDVCTEQLTLNYEDSAAPDCGGEVIRTWTATDDCGNVETLQQRIRILPTLQSWR